jgi:inosose dehydratase
LIRIANAPCSWGVLEFDGMSAETPWAVFLDELKAAGYAGTELGDWGYLPTDPTRLAEELGARELSLLGGFVPVALRDAAAHEAGAQEAVKVARLMAAVNPDAFVVLADDNGADANRTARAGRVRPEDGLDDDGWRTFCAGADGVARAVLDQTGLRTVFHHHAAGFVETPDESARLLAGTDPEVLGLCLDTGHWAFGGGDPRQALERFGDRVWHVHYKDCAPEVVARAGANSFDYFESVKSGVFCELGHGGVDLAGVTDDLRARGYDGWIVVEQDVLPGMGAPRESAARNRAHLASLGL